MGVNDDRKVTVRLALSVRDYLVGGTEADAMNRRLQASQRELGNESDRTSKKLTRLADSAEQSGKRTGRALLFTGAGLAALGATGGALRVLPPLLAATATGAAALPGILGGAANQAIVLKVGLSGISDQLGEIYKAKDPFTRLSPNAVNFLKVADQIKPTLLGVQQGLQQRVMRGTGADLELLATKTLPAVRVNLNALADDWADTFAEMSLAMSDPQVTDSWNVVLEGADRFFDQVNSRIRPTALALAGLVTDGQRVADAFGNALVGMLDRFNAKVESARRNGSLAEFFEAGAEAARDMANIAGNILEITGMVISEVSKQNDAMGTAGEKLDAYISSGRAAEDVAGIVHTLTVAWEGLASTVGPIAAMLRDALADPGVAASIGQMFTILATGSRVLSLFLQVLLSVNSIFGGLPLSIAAFVVVMGKLNKVMEIAQVKSAQAAVGLEKYGTTAGKVGGKLPGLVSGLGKTAGALIALDAAHSLLTSWTGDEADVDSLTRSLKEMADTGVVAGEATRLFGAGLEDMGAQLGFLTDDGVFANIVRTAEKIPVVGSLASDLASAIMAPFGGGAHTFTGSAENFAALDKAISDYAKTTGDAAGAQQMLQQIMDKAHIDPANIVKGLPNTTRVLGEMHAATERLQTGTAGLAKRQGLLNAPLQETVTIGRSLLDVYTQLNGTQLNFASATSAAEAAVDALQAGLKKNGLALDANKTGFDLTNEKGRANFELMKQLTTGAATAAQAQLNNNGTLEDSAATYDRFINQSRTLLALQGATPETIEAMIAKYAKMPDALEGVSTKANQLNDELDSIPKGKTFVFNGTTIADGAGRTLELKDGIAGLPQGKTFTWNGKALVDGKGKVFELTTAIQDVPQVKKPKVDTGSIDGAKRKVDTLAQGLLGLPDGTAIATVDTSGAQATLEQLRANIIALGGTYRPDLSNIPKPKAKGKKKSATGGIYTRAAADGLVEAQVAPPGTLYQWAEPETGGEAFVPRRGNRARGRAILDEAATWYGGRFVAMARGGVTAAASGLVNVAPKTVSAKATPLDYAESYLRARDAVKALSTSLKENGRSFSVATVKGRENRSAMYAGIRAAQDAAKARYEETGSVKAANAAYDEHIGRLRATLQQQKVNAETIKGLMALAQRPTYDTSGKAPRNSLPNIAFTRAAISAAAGVEELRDKLSLNQVGVGLGTEGGRDNLSNILAFFETAASAAQARYAQTGNAKSATTLYNSYITQLRTILKQSGYPAATINSLVSQYGRITLTSNARGGVYMAAGGIGGLSAPAVFPPGDRPLYGFAEPGTGGEMFLPRHGDRARGEDILRIGAGWYGGRYVSAGRAGDGGGTTINNNLNVTPLSYNPTTAELLGHMRLMDAQARVGRRR